MFQFTGGLIKLWIGLDGSLLNFNVSSVSVIVDVKIGGDTIVHVFAQI
jgi:hypothetical protein